MNSENVPANAYTDAPALHPQWLLGGLQLLGWLWFHPSAWRNYVARLTPRLEPDFVLFDLKSEHWRDRGFQRFLLIGYIILPILVSLIITLVFWSLGAPDKIMTNALAGATYTLAATMAVGLTVGVAAAPVYGLVMGLLVGVALPLLGGVAHSFIYSGAAGIASSILLSLTSPKPNQSLKKYLIGFVVAILITSLLVFLIYNVVSSSLPPAPGPAQADKPIEPENAEVLGIIASALYGIIYGLIVWQRSHSYYFALVVGLIIGLGGGLSYSLLIRNSPEAFVYHVAAGVAGGLLFVGLFSVPYLFGKYLAGVWVGTIIGTLIAGVSWIPLAPYIFPQTLPNASEMLFLSLVTTLLGLTWIWWRQLLLYPPFMALNLWLYQRDKQLATQGASYLRFHSAFWDEFQFIPLIGLDTHLLIVTERAPAEGQKAINYLAAGRQHQAAKAAQIELFARQMEGCADIEAIKNAGRLLTAGDLSGSVNALLASFRRSSEDVKSALHHDTPYHKLQALNDVSDGLNKLVRELNLASSPHARRFQPIAVQWYHIVVNHQDKLIRLLEKRQEIDNPYIVGLPLSEKQQDIFVGRRDMIARIKQFLQEGHRTSLLVYGQRRMGKTSLLHNLGSFLPSTIVPLFVDEQGAAYGDSYADHLYSVSKQMRKSAEAQRGLILPALPRETLVDSPFIIFNDWLDEVEQVLADQDRTIFLLMVDEIEMLKQMTDKKRFDIEDLLNLFRNLIQHRPKFKVVLAGSQTLEELQQWASYLINLEAIKLSYLTAAEALQLIEQPIPNFNLRYEFEASQRVLKLTRGHPYLIQLLCHEIVICKNKQPFEQRYLVTLAEVEAAVPNALAVGNLFFANIQNQIDETGLALIRFLAKQGQDALISRDALTRQFSDNLDQTLAQLQRRDLIEVVDGKYQFQVELFRYWFEQLQE